jgi:hypothetical protein
MGKILRSGISSEKLSRSFAYRTKMEIDLS